MKGGIKVKTDAKHENNSVNFSKKNFAVEFMHLYIHMLQIKKLDIFKFKNHFLSRKWS